MARNKRLAAEMKIFGRELSPEEFNTLKKMLGNEYGSYVGTDRDQAELHLAVATRKDFFAKLANRKVTPKENVELANLIVAEVSAEKKLHAARLDGFPDYAVRHALERIREGRPGT